MPQPKSTASSAAKRRTTTAAKPKATAAKPRASATAAKPAAAAKKPATRKPAATKTATAAAKPSATRKPAARKPAAAPKAAAAPKPAAARKPTPQPPAKPQGDPLGQLVGALRDQLSNRVIEPLDLVMLAGNRIQEALDEAVDRGRVSRGDANDLVGELVRRGREQTDDVLGNLDELLGKGLDQLAALSRKLEGTATKARRADQVDRLMRSADRARRAVGVGPSFPILGYDDLSAPKVSERLGDLSPAELRKVRDYERRHANRKSVLAAIEKALA